MQEPVSKFSCQRVSSFSSGPFSLFLKVKGDTKRGAILRKNLSIGGRSYCNTGLIPERAKKLNLSQAAVRKRESCLFARIRSHELVRKKIPLLKGPSLMRRPPEYSSNLCPPKTFAIWLWGVFWASFLLFFLIYKRSRAPLEESYSKCLRPTQIRWVIWRSSTYSHAPDPHIWQSGECLQLPWC